MKILRNFKKLREISYKYVLSDKIDYFVKICYFGSKCYSEKKKTQFGITSYFYSLWIPYFKPAVGSGGAGRGAGAGGGRLRRGGGRQAVSRGAEGAPRREAV